MKKKKNKAPRMDYWERNALEIKFGRETICGYARLYYRSGDYIRARCSLIDGPCKRVIPMEISKCGVYLDWLKVRQDKMRLEGLL